MSMSTSTATTFRVSNKTPEIHHFFSRSQDASSLQDQFKYSSQYRENKCTEILQMSKLEGRVYCSDNGFVRTVVDAYNRHHNLALRPDDVWAAIMTQFSFYINKNAEEFREKFVAFEGKKELEVKADGSLRSAPYGYLTKLMSEEIDRNLVDPEVKQWVLPSFSTTTNNDLVSIGVVFMATMKMYFDFSMGLTCGIPEITLEGTAEDWLNVLERLGKLKEYKLEKWYDMLEPILQQFVNTKQGKVDLEFWQKIAHHESEGSGSDYISGWITAFCVFDKDGNWQGTNLGFANGEVKLNGMMQKWLRLDTCDIPTGIVEVNVKINDNETEYKGIMFAGHLAAETKENGYTLQPRLGWVMALKGDEVGSTDEQAVHLE